MIEQEHDTYLQKATREDIDRSVALLRSSAEHLVPDWVALDPDPANLIDSGRADLAGSWEFIANALMDYHANATGEAQLMAELDEMETPKSEAGNLERLEARTASEWEDALRNRRARFQRLVELEAPRIIKAHEEVLVQEAKAGLAWQRARAIREREGL